MCVCDYTEISYKDLTLNNCENWLSSFYKTVICMPDARAEVHRAGRQERKTDTKWGKKKQAKNHKYNLEPMKMS